MTSRLAVALPPAILLAVAAVQMTLAHTSELSPWKGGGFGMFASVDGLPFRTLRVFVEAPDRSAEIALPQALDVSAAKVLTFPHRRAMEKLAIDILDVEEAQGRSAQSLRLELWYTEFSRTLESTHVKARVVTVAAHDLRQTNGHPAAR